MEGQVTYEFKHNGGTYYKRMIKGKWVLHKKKEILGPIRGNYYGTCHHPEFLNEY